MQKSRKRIAACILFSLMLLFVFAVPANAATKKQFSAYIKTHYTAVYGKVKAKKYDVSHNMLDGYLDQSGVVKFIYGDFNGDKKKDAIVFYIKRGEIVNGRTRKPLYAVLLTSKGETIRKCNELCLCDANAPYYSDIRAYLKSKGKTKYLVIQSMGGIDGYASSLSVLNVTKKNKLSLKKMLIDPGYTSAQGLYEYSKSGVKKDLSVINYSISKELLDTEDMDSGFVEVGKIMNSKLKKYGISVKLKSVWNNGKYWLVSENSSVKRIFRISGERYSGTGIYTNMATKYKVIIS